jgi:hypothetical protein
MSYSYSENKGGEIKLEALLKIMAKSYVKVGFPSGKEPGKPDRQSEDTASSMADVATIAAIQEFGTTRAGRGNSVTIPSRPFMKNALDTNKKKLGILQGKLSTEILEGKRSVQNGLEIIGEFMVGNIKRAINDMTDPPNAESSIKAKGSSHPLIDSGQMKNSVTYIVMKTGSENKETENEREDSKI